MSDIIRTKPQTINYVEYPKRHSSEKLQELNEMVNNVELKNMYDNWNLGINIITGRKIKIGGAVHKRIKYKFQLFDICNNVFEYPLIDIDKYLSDSDRINKQISIENKSIKDYNEEVYICNSKVKLLTDWNDFVEFDNKKYGLPYIDKDVHLYNNCYGKINKINSTCESKMGNCRPFMNEPDIDYITETYECSKCLYTYIRTSTKSYGGSTDKSSMFWWK